MAEPLVPPGVVTVMFLGPIAAVLVVLKVAVMVAELTTVTPVTVKPFAGGTTLTVDPAVKLLPIRVTATGLGAAAVLRRPEGGLIEERIGVPGFTTVKVTGVVVPVGVVTVTFLAVSAAVDAIVNVALTCVSLTTVTPLTVMAPPVTLTAVAPVRLMPVNTTGWVVPRAPVLGAMANNPLGGTVTVKVSALLVPPGAVTVTFLAPAVAFAETASVALTVVSLTTVMLLTVMPLPLTLIADVPVSPVPVSVIGTLAVPRLAEAGLMPVSTGPVIANGCVLLAPPGVVTSTLIEPFAAALVLVMVAVMVVLLTTVTPVIVTPVAGGLAMTADPVTKLVPVKVTGTDVPRNSVAGEIDASAGAGGATTVNVTLLLVPPGVLTVTFLAVSAAFGATVKVVST